MGIFLFFFFFSKCFRSPKFSDSDFEDIFLSEISRTQVFDFLNHSLRFRRE